MTTVLISRPTKSGPWVGKVPLVAGTLFLAARLPAAASIGMMIRNLPMRIARPIVRLYQGVLALMPANELPLLAAPLVYA